MIRIAAPHDAKAINDIYAYSIKSESPETPEVDAMTESERKQWITHRPKNHPVLVYEKNGEYFGFGCLRSAIFNPFDSTTVQVGVYMHPKCRGGVVGAILFSSLIAMGYYLGFKHIVSIVIESNAKSIRTTEHAFLKVGVLTDALISKLGPKNAVLFHINYATWHTETSCTKKERVLKFSRRFFNEELMDYIENAR